MNQPTDWVNIEQSVLEDGMAKFCRKVDRPYILTVSFIDSPICLIFPLNPSNENVSRVYRLVVLRAEHTVGTYWRSMIAPLIGSNHPGAVYIGSQTPRAPEGAIRAGKTVGPGLIHFVCFTSIAFKCHNLPQICHVQSVESGAADSSRYLACKCNNNCSIAIPDQS